MTTKVAMLQPNYIPWKGVFDLIHRVDKFVFYDDVQYTKRDWRNRNKIKTKDGELWLSVPVKNAGKKLIYETEIDNETDWQSNHVKSIRNSYAKAPHFKMYDYLLSEIYETKKWTNISELNVASTKLIAKALNISVEWHLASELKCTGSKDGEKILKICEALKCDYFINGPAAKGFIDQNKFMEAGVELDYIDYSYPEYPQVFPPFNHFVSVLDVLFNCGEKAPQFIFK
jgi:hypothetical protein